MPVPLTLESLKYGGWASDQKKKLDVYLYDSVLFVYLLWKVFLPRDPDIKVKLRRNRAFWEWTPYSFCLLHKNPQFRGGC